MQNIDSCLYGRRRWGKNEEKTFVDICKYGNKTRDLKDDECAGCKKFVTDPDFGKPQNSDSWYPGSIEEAADKARDRENTCRSHTYNPRIRGSG
jgi:hypothetical protein